ncbi:MULTISPECIES: GrxA family glutaredoxin [Aeromonas]|uniref:GrxA family glutaredoxin n=1 Tax=Aeromonas eucrenophila TaxID=649 RepID=A0ABW0YH10_9GAMM|nr:MULTISPECIES: GrxA family glutaredoxin [Aeromonas]MCH7371766.1 GrxA family glutaredoxin [Aeromonas sp. MR16]
MFVEIFGRPGCPYCVRAKQIAEQLTEERDDFEFRYVDINAEGLTKDDLAVKAGKPVTTVPQIFLDEQHIGGCTDFEAYARANLGL